MDLKMVKIAKVVNFVSKINNRKSRVSFYIVKLLKQTAKNKQIER